MDLESQVLWWRSRFCWRMREPGYNVPRKRPPTFRELTGKLSEITPEKPIRELIKCAVNVKERAYCPYSNFRVGAAILCTGDSIITGVNVENASYGLSVCAERVAIMNAVSHGHKDFKAMAISCDIKDSFKAPCGACRQFFAEFNLEMDLYLVKPDLTSQKIKVSEILPMAFTPDSLNEQRI